MPMSTAKCRDFTFSASSALPNMLPLSCPDGTEIPSHHIHPSLLISLLCGVLIMPGTRVVSIRHDLVLLLSIADFVFVVIWSRCIRGRFAVRRVFVGRNTRHTVRAARTRMGNRACRRRKGRYVILWRWCEGPDLRDCESALLFQRS